MGNGIMSFFTVDIDSGQQKPSPIISKLIQKLHSYAIHAEY